MTAVAELVLRSAAGIELYRYNYSTPRRAWQACHMVRSQLRGRSQRLLIISDHPGESGFHITTGQVATALVHTDQPAAAVTDHTTDRHP